MLGKHELKIKEKKWIQSLIRSWISLRSMDLYLNSQKAIFLKLFGTFSIFLTYISGWIKLPKYKFNKRQLKDHADTLEDEQIYNISISKERIVKEPAWFTDYRIENDKRWEEQMKFNEKVMKSFDLLFSLPTIKKEIEDKKN